MGILPGVLGFCTLRRTVQVRLGCKTLRLPGTRRKRLRCAWHAHLHGLATAIHEKSGLNFHFEIGIPNSAIGYTVSSRQFMKHPGQPQGPRLCPL
jgi:hypothetical protein